MIELNKVQFMIELNLFNSIIHHNALSIYASDAGHDQRG
jgi:hypothetical protein